MSYIQIEIGGRLRGLKFNQYAHIIVQEKLDPIHLIASSSAATFYGGLKGNCFVKDERFTKTVDENGNLSNPNEKSSIEKEATFEDVCEWVEDIDAETIGKVLTIYMSSTSYLRAKGDDDKKKEPLPEASTEPNVTESPAAD